jgi:hypothetical protein
VIKKVLYKANDLVGEGKQLVQFVEDEKEGSKNE